MRKVDYNLEEFSALAGLPRKKCRDNLVRICTEYGFQLTDFKVEADNENSDFIFAPEIAGPLALLVKYWDQYPYARKNVDKTKVTASSIANYNAEVLDGIDSEITQYFSDAIYSLNGHLVAKEVADWTEPFVRELTHFMVNISTMSYENVGEAMCYFTQRLNEMNYYLHRGGFTTGKTQKNRKEYLMRCMALPDDSDIDKALQKQNLGLDKILAYLIRWQLEGVHRMRKLDFPDIKDIIEMENRRLLFLGQEIILCNNDGEVIELDSISDMPREQQRELYINLVLGKTIDVCRVKLNRNAVNVKLQQRKKWKPIECEIKEGTFDGATVKDEYRRYLNNEILKKQKELEMLQHQLSEYESSKTVPRQFRIEDDSTLKERQDDYVEYCKLMDINYKSLYDAVDVFVGQALNEFLKG
jgi:hypothetical protein